MSGAFASIGLPEIIAGIMVLALNAYVLMGGADFGGGVWDLLAGGPRRDEQRELITKSIAPIWEANHVWLIVVVVLMFTAFPIAFSTLAIVLHIPITLMLIGIVMRGSAFVFRSYGSRARSSRRRWGVAFAGASAVTPVLLGMIIGSIASGDVAMASGRVGAASFRDVFISPWLAPFPIAVGLFALALFAFLAAVYLTIEAKDDDALRDDFRARALIAAFSVALMAALALALSRSAAPRVMEGVVGGSWSWLLHVCTGSLAVTAIVALWRRKFRLARLAAAMQVSLILWGWVLAQYPFIIPMTISIRQASAPRVTLELLLVGLGGGALVLIPSLRYLLRTFAGHASETRGSI
ncbi:MAG TPA: cytochrome d ubiquinol oxidase subunit II [Gemmatimonadaceae bacterium]|nr:cytochrome d ubiquinol oxidase subunit II [Gemmatimonadaceae bacterium]